MARARTRRRGGRGRARVGAQRQGSEQDGVGDDRHRRRRARWDSSPSSSASLRDAAPELGEPASQATPVTAMGVASAAALIFFAFAGYARLATLGEEVRDPARTIPRAVAIAVAIVVVVYMVLGAVLLRRPGVAALIGADAPLTLAVPDTALWRSGLAALAALAAGGALVALMAGIGRTAMAMARAGDLPRVLGRTSPTTGVPQVAEAVAGVAAIAVAWWADLGFALAMSSVSVLTYYAIANAAAFAARGRATGICDSARGIGRRSRPLPRARAVARSRADAGSGRRRESSPSSRESVVLGVRKGRIGISTRAAGLTHPRALETKRRSHEENPMKATWNGTVIAESDDTVVVEGNHYFPRDSIKPEFFRESDTDVGLPVEGRRRVLRRRRRRLRQRGRRVALRRPQGRCQADHRSRRVLEGRRRLRLGQRTRAPRGARVPLGVCPDDESGVPLVLRDGRPERGPPC